MKYTVDQCDHPKLTLPDFNEEKAIKMTSDEVRQHYPRKTEKCPDCGAPVIMYASFMHYICGDW